MDEPGIVKELREAEKLGILQSKTQNAYEELELSEVSFENVPCETVGFVEDNDDERKAEDAAINHGITGISSHEIKDKYRLITESTSDLISLATFKINPTYTYISPSCKKILGYEPEEMIGKSCFDFIHPNDKKNLTSLLKKYLEMKAKKLLTGKESELVEKFECCIRDKSGNWHYLENTANFIDNELLFVSKDITERKKAEAKLIEREKELRFIPESSLDIIFTLTKAGKITYISRSAEFFGFEPKEMIGNFFTKYVPKKELPKYLKKMKEVSVHKKVQPFESYIKNRNGEPIPVEINGQLVEKEGKLIAQGTIRDITERKKAEEMLKESEEKYRTFVDTASDLMLITDKDGNFTDVNKAMTKVLRYSKEDMIGMNIPQILTKEALENDFKPNWEKFITEGELSIDTTFVTKNGNKICGELKAVAIYDSDGEYAGSRAVFHDLTERKKAEVKLKESEKKYRNLVETAPDGILTIDFKGVITSCNTTALEMVGYPRDEYVGKRFTKLGVFRKRDIPKLIKMFTSVIRGKEIPPVEFKFVHKDGTEKWAEGHYNIQRKNGSIMGMEIQAIIRDITERKKTEKELIEREKEFRFVTESSLDTIFTLTKAGKLTYISPSAKELFGFEPKEMIGTSFTKYVPKEELPKYWKALGNVLFHKKIPGFETYIKNRNGNIVPVEINGQTVEKEGKLIAQGTIRDITKRKKTEEELEEAHDMLKMMNKELERKVKERTAEVEKLLHQKDEFVNQLSHDLKTPLTPLVTLLPLLEQRVDDLESKKMLKATISGSNHMKNLVFKALQLAELNSSKIEFNIEEINLLSEVNKTVGNNRLLFDENNIDVKNMVDEKIMVKADKLQLNEVFTNLFTNAVRYSSEEKSNITIDAKKEKNDVVVSVKDNGMGMTSEQQKYVFDEFYKTDYSRHDLDSSGLGLPICKRIVEKHGGRIWVESPGPGKGSTFYFTLKLEDENNE